MVHLDITKSLLDILKIYLVEKWDQLLIKFYIKKVNINYNYPNH